ncbi:MucBP domain-containing protein [Enterococcus ureilyticus]|uniref:MucBP domain-containing protein n=1 Tax=Enterococcus ureilyticus TaxID=1131292 RepID=UPI001A9148C0|nr:MucBP domain-containing protein [Enterococcus ureilyticus]MBO0446581.1 MucBP domain-containing protein [Enterococcus ureilyticus]
MTKEKRLQKALTEEKYKCRMVKLKKNWVIKGMLFSTLLVGEMSIQTSVYAEEWSANAPESIQIESGATSYTLKEGDTLWAISQVTNIKVETLAEINNIDLSSGEQYSLEIGRVIYFDGNHVTILDKDGNIVADKVLNDNDKVDSSKPFAGQSSDNQKNPVTADDNGNVKTQRNTNSNQNGNNSNVNSNEPNTGNNNSQGNSNKPVNPKNPEKPVKPEVTPEVKEFVVSVVYKDTDGNILGKDADVSVEENKQFTVEARTFEGFTLQGTPTQTVKVKDNTTITFTYKKNAETPIPAEKFEVTVAYVDTDGNTLADTNTVKVEDGESYTATAKTIEGYTLQGEPTQTVVVSKNTTIKFVYSKNTAPVEKFDVTVQYLDKNGENIAYTEVSENIEKGQVFIATAKTIDGYTVIGNTTQTVTVTGNTTIKFIYKKDATPVTKFNVTVEYKDVEGNLLSSDVPVEVEEGKSFTASAKTIEGYTLVGDATQTEVVTGDTTLTFEYKKDATPVVVDKTTLQTTVNNVKDTVQGNYTTDSWTEFETALGVANSVLSDAEATQQEVNQANTNLQNAFDNLEEKVPEVNKFMVTVNHKDTDGKMLETEVPVEVEEGKQFTANAMTLTGYTLQGATTQTVTVTGDTTITFNYKKDEVIPPTMVTIDVEHVDTDGNVLGTDAPVQVEQGQSYTANAKTFSGYTLQGATSQTVTADADKTITFVYKKDEVTPPEQNVSEVEQAIASQALALINQHRNNKGLISLNNQSALQQGADVRSNEIFELYEHTRPNGEDGADAPYDYGYDQVVFAENIGMYNNPSSLEWLAQNGASIVVNAWINSPGHNANLLLNGINEGSVGIHLEENGSGKYTMGSVFLGAKNYSMPTKASRSVETPKEQTELKFNIQETNVVGEELPKETTQETETTEETKVEQTESSEQEATEGTIETTVEVTEETTDTEAKQEVEEQVSEIETVNKSQLLEAYNLALTLDESNYNVHSWSTLMIKLADAKYVYDNLEVSQSDINNATLALQQAINNLV